jgi:hypothetical protein
MAEFVVLKDGVLLTFENYDDIPEKFDNLIKFIPDYNEGPHSHEEHEEISLWNEKLKNLMKRETNARSN